MPNEKWSKTIIDIEEKWTKDHYYKNIKLHSGFDKKKIFFEFVEKHISKDEEKVLLLLDLKSQFDLWYQHQYVNYPIIEMYDLKFYISLILKKYDPNIFGWKGFNFKN